MITLLNQAIEKIGKYKIEKILLRPCAAHATNVHEQKPGCGVYSVDFFLKKKFYIGKGSAYIDIAYVSIQEMKPYLTHSSDINWKKNHTWADSGEFDGIPLVEALTGGPCVFCNTKLSGKPLEELLDRLEKPGIDYRDPYVLYNRPDMTVLKEFQSKMKL
jgi:hypothetical protein